MNTPIILLVSGSIRKESHTRNLTAYITEVLKQKGADARHWNLLEKPLPMVIPELRADISNHPDANVREFGQMATDADAFVFASPIYHNSYSGVLKNALDHLRTPHLTYKPVGLASHGGDRSKQAVDHLRLVVRAFAAIAIPKNVCVDEDDFDGHQIKGDEMIQRIDEFCDELILFAKTMQPLRKEKMIKDK